MVLHVDHRVPRSLGGSDDLDNCRRSAGPAKAWVRTIDSTDNLREAGEAGAGEE